MRQVAEIAQELVQDRHVQPIMVTIDGHGFRRGRTRFRRGDVGGITGHQLQQEEVEHQNADHRRHHAARIAQDGGYGRRQGKTGKAHDAVSGTEDQGKGRTAPPERIESDFQTTGRA